VPTLSSELRNKLERVVIEAREAAGLREPVFAPEAFFRAIFHRSLEFSMKDTFLGVEATDRKPEAKTTQKTTQKTAQKIIALILKKPEITRQELAVELGISDSGVKYHLKKMQDKGVIRRVGPDKGGHWEVLQ
jgi:ATP-dependent DNA helicase RecG